MAVPLDDALDLLVLVVGGDEKPRWMRTNVGGLNGERRMGSTQETSEHSQTKSARISPSARKYSWCFVQLAEERLGAEKVGAEGFSRARTTHLAPWPLSG